MQEETVVAEAAGTEEKGQATIATAVAVGDKVLKKYMGHFVALSVAAFAELIVAAKEAGLETPCCDNEEISEEWLATEGYVNSIMSDSLAEVRAMVTVAGADMVHKMVEVVEEELEALGRVEFHA